MRNAGQSESAPTQHAMQNTMQDEWYVDRKCFRWIIVP
jgi:hypothetical protein